MSADYPQVHACIVWIGAKHLAASLNTRSVPSLLNPRRPDAIAHLSRSNIGGDDDDFADWFMAKDSRKLAGNMPSV